MVSSGGAQTGEMLLYSDDVLLAVNKPAGLRVIPDGYDPTLPFLQRLLEQEYGRVWVVHRLDKDTSGVILFARSAAAHRSLNQQFEHREVNKEYHAIAAGMPDWESITLDLPLKVNGDRKHRTVINHQTGKPAQTEVRVLRRFGLFVLLSAQPHSGYTHQIRAHLAAVALPLLGDPLYHSLRPETQADRQAAAAAQGLPITRAALHAYQIHFTHPTGGQPITILAPYPADFRQTIELLSNQPS